MTDRIEDSSRPVSAWFAVDVQRAANYMDTMDEAPSLAEILRDLTYPAEKWQITTCAEIYGADVRTRRELYGLPARTYRTAAEITDSLG